MSYAFATNSMQTDRNLSFDMKAGAHIPDAGLVAALRRRDEAALEQLIERYQGALLRTAMNYVASFAVAEEVVQETWVSLLQSLDRFEGRCSLKTWIFRILANRAKARGIREARCVPFSALQRPDYSAEPAVDPTAFEPASHQWITAPLSWETIPEERMLAKETHAHIQRAIAALPSSQRTVIVLRDIEGRTSEEVCGTLNISEANQRVLLHRARSKVRQALEQYFDAD
ncbi:MAG TPA: sigma-70 family RNA polymerase sigma factor [Roseiflexaceae bacterium]|nr:sigma-70 family RNA polymerase sigma factor [Roseiflexaceae bacterium]